MLPVRCAAEELVTAQEARAAEAFCQFFRRLRLQLHLQLPHQAERAAVAQAAAAARSNEAFKLSMTLT